MAQRVVVFLDWQNIYRRGRAAFCTEGDPHMSGQVDPFELGRALADRVDAGTLHQVRIYRGIPTNKNDPKGYAANRRQTAQWVKRGHGLVHVYLRPLQYLEGHPAREKGIDVRPAIDFVTMAVHRQYDVGVLFSTDTDLTPALDMVFDLGGRPGPIPQVAAWSGPKVQRRRIAASGKRNVWCHWLDQAVFDAVGDSTDYGRA